MARLLLRNASIKQSLYSAECFTEGILGTAFHIRNFSVKGRRKSKSDESDSGDEHKSKKELALQQAIDQITTSFGKGSIMWLGRSIGPRNVPVVSTGSFSLDIALGIGGLPKGRVVEIYGPEASGKTTLGLHVIAESQKHGGYCVFVDAEHALDPALAEAIGVKTDNLLLAQPDCGEQALSLVDTLIRSGSVDVVVVDSVRSKLSTFGFGGPTEVTSGGNALKFYASVRLHIKRIGLVKKGEEAVGSQVLVKIVKNKHSPPFKTAQFELEFGKGICRDSEIIELGCKHKYITKAGGAFYHMNGQSFRGRDAIKRYFAENEGAREELMLKLREKLMHHGTEKKAPDAETPETPDASESEEIVTAETTDEEVGAAVEA